MIINEGAKSAEVLSTGVTKSIDMTIDDSDREVLMMIMSKGLYSDPIGSIVREWSSNALDATREAGNDEPIIVSLKQDKNYNWNFSVQDFGTGMSPDRIVNVVSKYAASTKRDRGDQLGYFGLGLKSGLAYADAFTIETIFEGIKYTYSMYEGENGTKIDLLNSSETQEKNGSIVSILIKDWGDKDEFRSKIKEQLAYFEGVYFDVPGIDNNAISIIEGDNWKLSSITSDRYLHLCLDNVYYPLDFQKLGIPRIECAVALNFKVTDGLIPTPSRESIRLTPSVKQLILNKIAAVADELVTKYNTTVTGDAADIFSIWHEIGNTQHSLKISEYVRINISGIAKKSGIEISSIKLKGVELLDLEIVKNHSENILDYFYVRGKINNKVYTTKVAGDQDGIVGDLLYDRRKIVLCNDVPGRVLVDYIKDTSLRNVSFISRKSYVRGLGRKTNNYSDEWRKSYKSILNLQSYPKNQWRQLIKEYQLIEAQFVNKLTKLEDIKPDKEWLERRKANRAKGVRRKVAKEQIVPKYGYLAARGKYTTGYRTVGVIDTKDLPNTMGYFVYFMEKDIETKKKIDDLLKIFRVKKSSYPLQAVALTEKDYRKVEGKNIHNWVKFSKFMEGEGKIFGRYCTLAKIHSFRDNNYDIFESIDFINDLNSDLAEKMKQLDTYRGPKFSNFPKGELLDDMLNVCEKNDLWDTSIYDIFLEVQKRIKKLDFLTLLKNIDSETLPLAKEILRGRKFKLNLKEYQAPEVAIVGEEVFNEDEEFNDDNEETFQEALQENGLI